jgi:hypothetical protein
VADLVLVEADRAFLREAVRYLENPSFFMRMTSIVGRPLEKAAGKLPEKVQDIAQAALRKTMETAILTLKATDPASADRDLTEASQAAVRTGFWHKMTTAALGAAGGFAGIAGSAVELPMTTGVIFRSIAAIAETFGEDLNDPLVRLECLSVFGFGAPSNEKSATSTYLAGRLALALATAEAAQFVKVNMERPVAQQVALTTAPVMVRLLATLSARFSTVVTQKLLAQSIPVVGAVTGASLNLAFTDHFNSVARYHFGLRRLERQYGADPVQALYRQEFDVLRAEQAAQTTAVAETPS